MEHGVWWDERDGVTGLTRTESRKFSTKSGADEFAATLVSKQNVRVYGLLPSDPVVIEKRFYDEQCEHAAANNRRRMVELMLQHGITIPAREIDKWRPTEEKTGRIEGVSDGLTCVMTNGVLGYFIREGREPLYGHIEWFKWDVEEVHMIPYFNEAGERRFFKQIKNSGAPSPYHRQPPKTWLQGEVRAKKAKVKKAPISTAQARAQVDKLLAKFGLNGM